MLGLRKEATMSTIQHEPPRRLGARIPGKYVSLVSFKRDGTPVATPMWFVVDGERLLAITDAHSAKVKRVRRNPEVTVAACGAGGQVTGEPFAARAELLPPNDLEHVQQLIARKYRVDRALILPLYNLVQRLRGKRRSGEAAVLAVTLADLG
jgi:PPOX class probable F420-dependent enzyme